MRVGKKQLELLIMLGSPTVALMHQTRETPAMVRRGLLREERAGKTAAGFAITSAGLRALADAMDAGRVKDGLARIKAEAAARMKAQAVKRAKGKRR